jgi:hypothetical protein
VSGQLPALTALPTGRRAPAPIIQKCRRYISRVDRQVHNNLQFVSRVTSQNILYLLRCSGMQHVESHPTLRRNRKLPSSSRWRLYVPPKCLSTSQDYVTLHSENRTPHNYRREDFESYVSYTSCIYPCRIYCRRGYRQHAYMHTAII